MRVLVVDRERDGCCTCSQKMRHTAPPGRFRNARTANPSASRRISGRKPWVGHVWPAAVALLVLGRVGEDELIHAASEERNDIARAVEIARDDLYKRRLLVQALFYLATEARSEGREEPCHTLMRQCAALGNPVIEIEWYLARSEAEGAGVAGAG